MNVAGAPDAGVGEAHPDAEHERIGEEQQQEARRRQHEPGAEHLAVGLQPLPGGGLADRGLGDGSHGEIGHVGLTRSVSKGERAPRPGGRGALADDQAR